MPAPGQSTFDGNPNASPPITVPYRPGITDFNGGALADNPQFPPNALTMPTAGLFNTYSAMLVALGRLVPVLRMSIVGGNPPTFGPFTAAPTAVQSLPATSTFTPTRVGAGNVQITWPANTFGQAIGIALPSVSLNVVGGAHSYSSEIVAITNGVQVYTEQDGALTDLSFTFEVW